jgi:hypothetical protein
MNWGWKIFILYTSFVILTLAMVFFTMKQDVFLVSKDYYKEEIEYQDQIDKIENAKKLDQPLVVSYNETENMIRIVFPEKQRESGISGEVILFRPSDARLDRKYEVQSDGNADFEIPTQNIKKGNWKIKIAWQAMNKEFYYEQALNLK